MALQFFDGFDDYGTANQTAFNNTYVVYNNTVLGTISGVFGGTGIGYYDGEAGQFVKQLPNPVSSVVTGFRQIFTSSVGELNGFTILDTSGNYLVQVGVSSTSGVATVSASRNGSLSLRAFTLPGTSLGTPASVVLNASTWYELELSLVVGSGTSGSLIVKINGNVILNYSGINTQGSAGPTIGFIGAFLSDQPNSFIDDFYICDTTGPAPYNTFLTAVAGPMGPRVYTLFPNSNSSVTWTPLSGNNYSEVNASSFQGDSSYVSSSTPGNQDLYGIPTPLAQIGTVIGSVLAVQTAFVGREDDAGTRQVSASIESGSSVFQGSTRTMIANYEKYFDIYVNDPITSAPWAASKFNTAGQVFVGVKCQA